MQLEKQGYPLHHIDTKGLRISYFDEGAGPVIICLHGFPDSAHTWRTQLKSWTAAGYRVVTPFMRGYAPSGLAKDGDYSPAAIGDDVIELMDDLAIESAMVVGHDWGAVAAFMATTKAPERFFAVVMAAVPPVRSFEGVIREGDFLTALWQLRRSAYMLLFQLPFLSEWWVQWRKFRYVRTLWRRWSPGWSFPQQALQPVQAALSGPHLRAALCYYRHTLRPPYAHRFWTRARAPLTVPTLFVYGEKDGCIDAEMFSFVAEACDAPFETLCLKDTGHFMHREKPALFSSAVLRFAAQHQHDSPAPPIPSSPTL